VHSSIRLGTVVSDDHAFSRRQAIRFHCDRISELVECGDTVGDRFHAHESRGRDPHSLHEFLRMDLARLELGCILRWPDDFAILGTKLIGYAGYQRNLGPDYSKVRTDALRGCQVVRGRDDLAELCNSRVSRCRKNLVAFVSEAPCECVLASAAADDEDLHGENLRVYRATLE
jgi:hypothetical protein